MLHSACQLQHPMHQTMHLLLGPISPPPPPPLLPHHTPSPPSPALPPPVATQHRTRQLQHMPGLLPVWAFELLLATVRLPRSPSQYFGNSHHWHCVRWIGQESAMSGRQAIPPSRMRWCDLAGMLPEGSWNCGERHEHRNIQVKQQRKRPILNGGSSR